LLLAENYAQQRAEDERWYRLICCWLEHAPSMGELFPLWAEGAASYTDDDDEQVFLQTTATMTSYRN
jgi:hypothetical protein